MWHIAWDYMPERRQSALANLVITFYGHVARIKYIAWHIAWHHIAWLHMPKGYMALSHIARNLAKKQSGQSMTTCFVLSSTYMVEIIVPSNFSSLTFVMLLSRILSITLFLVFSPTFVFL